MSYQVLARKWRPRRFEDVVGQTHVVQALSNALSTDRIHHAFLFSGTRGVGKTTIARILAKCLNCESGVTATPCGECSACTEIDEGRFIDLIEVDAASRTKVDETRDLLENVPYAPTRGRYKVYLIDEVHMFSKHSFNALLKTLEEPPEHVKFLLATTDPQNLPVTVLSRCLQFHLKPLPEALIAGHLQVIIGEEGVNGDADSLRLLSHAAAGSIRDALSLLDQAIAYSDGKLDHAAVSAMLGTIDRNHVYALLQAVSCQDARAVLDCIQAIYDQGTDFDRVLDEMLAVLQQVAMLQVVPDAIAEDAIDYAPVKALADGASREDVQLYYQIGLTGRRDLPLSPDPMGGFRMLMLRMLAFRPAQVSAKAAPAPPPATAAPRADAGSAKSAPVTAAAAPQAPPVAATTGGEDDWAAMIEAMSVNGMVRELASNCVFEGRDGDTVRLTLSAQHAKLRSKGLESRLQEAVGGYYNEAVRLVIAAGDVGGASPAEQRRQAEAERQHAAEEQISRDPNVQAICDAFDGTVDEDSIQPVD